MLKEEIKIDKTKIPKEVMDVLFGLEKAGYQAWIVGGSVRDLILGLEPNDWDVTTDANPEQIQAVFPRTYYENTFGTVGVVSHETENPLVVEVTPFRSEGKYQDGRHPDEVIFVKDIDLDLKRRDFTINNIAFSPIKDIIKDNNNGIKDIKDRVLRTVGEADLRFEEDYLRMLRAVRIANQLGFTIEKETEKSIIKHSGELKHVSRERIRDELLKIFNSPTPMIGFLMLQHTGLLKDIMPELEMGIGMKQTLNHKYDVYGHLLRSMQHARDKDFSTDLIITALLHDIAKPHTARLNKSTGFNTFHGHEVVGERVSREILNRLKFPQAQIERICKLIRWHMFNSDPDQVTMSAVRRMIENVGRENIWDLMNLRFCDRIGSGRPMEEPHRLRRYFAMIEEALTQPTNLKMLKINGQRVIEVTRETPGRRIGLILNALMGEVLENPELNTEEILVSRVTTLSKLTNEELMKLAQKGEELVEEEQEDTKKQIRKKFKV